MPAHRQRGRQSIADHQDNPEPRRGGQQLWQVMRIVRRLVDNYPGPAGGGEIPGKPVAKTRDGDARAAPGEPLQRGGKVGW